MWRYLNILLTLSSCFPWTYAVIGDEDSESTEKPYLSHTLLMDDGQKILLLDKVMSEDELQNISDYLLSLYTQMRYMHEERETGLEDGASPFHALFNKTDIKEFSFIKDARDLLQDIIGEKLYIDEIHGEILHSLDPKPPIRKTCNKNTYLGMIFINQSWRRNDYGQISFYTSSRNNTGTEKPRLEVMHTVHPKPARMVLWPSCVMFAAHPPSVNCFSNLFTLNMQLTTKDRKEKNIEEYSFRPTENRFGHFTFLNRDADRKIDYARHLVNTFYDKEKRGIYVFDDLFTTEELRQLRQHLFDVSQPSISAYDGNALEDNDNVQWLSQYGVPGFMKTQIWRRVKEVVTFVSDEDQWYPYDVALNLIRPADHTRIHPDAEVHQFEYTYLLYLSEGLTQNDFGETVWFEQGQNLDGIHQFTDPGGEEYEPLAAVWPKFGRVAVFRNVIEHSARPLSTSHPESRYTFAVKVCRTKRLALIKQLYESMEGYFDATEDKKEFSRDLIAGKHNEESDSPLTVEVLEDLLKMTKQEVFEQRATHHTALMEKLKNPNGRLADEL